MGGVGEKSEVSYHTWCVLKPWIECGHIKRYHFGAFCLNFSAPVLNPSSDDVFAIGSDQTCSLESKHKWFGAVWSLCQSCMSVPRLAIMMLIFTSMATDSHCVGHT